MNWRSLINAASARSGAQRAARKFRILGVDVAQQISALERRDRIRWLMASWRIRVGARTPCLPPYAAPLRGRR